MKTKTRRLQLAALLVAPVILTAAICGSPDDDTVDEGADASPTPAAVVEESPVAGISTLIPGLTDTGYTAVDGTPLYEECIAEGLPIPPEVSEPSGTTEPIATADPNDDPNEGKTAPTSDELPPFDVRTITPADTTGWTLHESQCYGYSILLPPDWTKMGSAAGGPTPAPGSYSFQNAGYQQGESTTLRSPGSPIAGKVDISISYSPNDADLRGRRLGLEENVYLISMDENVLISGKPARQLYTRVHGGALPGVNLSTTIAATPTWRLGLSFYLVEPYDAKVAAELAAILASVKIK